MFWWNYFYVPNTQSMNATFELHKSNSLISCSFISELSTLFLSFFLGNYEIVTFTFYLSEISHLLSGKTCLLLSGHAAEHGRGQRFGSVRILKMNSWSWQTYKGVRPEIYVLPVLLMVSRIWFKWFSPEWQMNNFQVLYLLVHLILSI